MKVLATDLDGTFLGGTERTRNALTRHFRDSSDRRLLYVTGRSTRSVMALVKEGALPAPDAMICDVGTFVAHADGTPDEGDVMQDLRASWGDRSRAVLSAFRELPGVRLQENFGPHRVSFYYDDPNVLPEAHAKAEALGCDGLASDNRFFDVLPRGINKGTTLKRLMQQWQVPTDNVLVAGDTLNDLSMLVSGYPAVVVGNAEPALLSQLPDSPHIIRAQGHGCEGIVEALRHLGVEVAHV